MTFLTVETVYTFIPFNLNGTKIFNSNGANVFISIDIFQMCVLWHKCTKWWLPLRKREQGVSLSGGAGAGGAGQRRKLDSRQE